jgi:tetratricopeptide (TPR) repeat protein
MGCGSAVVFVGWLSDLWRRKVAWAGGALVAATVLAPLLITGAWHLGSWAVAGRAGGDNGRLEFTSMALELIAEKPITGGGSRSFFFNSIKKWNVTQLYEGSGDIQYVHNEYLQAAVDYGLVGLALLLLLLGIAMFRGVAFIAVSGKDKGGDAGLALGAMAALCGMGVQAFFSFVYHVLPDIMLMGCCVGLLANQTWPLAKNRVSVQPENRLPWGRGLVASLLGIAVACFAWRDAFAWLTLRPGFDFSKPPVEEQVARLQGALQVRPDFRVMSELSKILVKMNRGENQSPETKQKRLETAIVVQQAAVKRAPNSYQDILNLALMYDSVARYEEAEPLFDSIVDDLDARERHYGARFHYSRHLVARANQLWHRREPEKALVLFLRAKEQLAKTITRYEGGDAGALSRSIESSIAFLEGANIKPLPGDKN